ncbi:MAG: pyridoxal phosphate-dependent aminotransferase [Ignavibacteriales bacterium]|nr:pyridoxal phosphate-dependent aminotransferase [Ignavibacteriales bacterium]
MRPLSKKLSAIERSQTMMLFARAKKMKADGIDVVSLTAGEPDFPTPQTIKDAAIKAINENFTKYTANQGIPELLKAVAEKFQRDNNLRFEPSQILVSSGAKHSLYNSLQAICNRGDEVVIPAPYWVSYPEMTKLVDAVPVIVKTSPANQFKMTPSQLKKAITRKTKAMILCSPSNPTGAVYTKEEILAIADVVESSGIYVISDEIYEKVVYDGLKHFSIGSVESVRDQVITVNGVSKAYSMTGWRIGFLGARGDITEAADKVQSQITSNANAIAQKAAYAALCGNLDGEVSAMVTEFDRRRHFLVSEFQKIAGLEFIYPRGAFYIFANVRNFLNKSANGSRIKTADDLCEHLLTKHLVATVPGSGFGAKDWVRMSYACSMADLQKAVERLHRALGELS